MAFAQRPDATSSFDDRARRVILLKYALCSMVIQNETSYMFPPVSYKSSRYKAYNRMINFATCTNYTKYTIKCWPATPNIGSDRPVS